jgi:two-component system, OmpR family, sensor histidine kinase ChvG
VLYLDTYERHLLDAQERAMAQQGRLLAAVAGTMPVLDPSAIASAFAAMDDRGDARMRVFDGEGRVIADSRRVPVRAAPPAASTSYPGRATGTAAADPANAVGSAEAGQARGSRVYRIGAWLYDASRWLRPTTRSRTPAGSAREREPDDWRQAREFRAALAGRYGSATRVSEGGQRSVTLFSAVPIRRDGRVSGVVLLSQSTYRLLQALYDVRRRVFAIVLWSAVAAGFLTLIVSATIVRPLRRLRSDAAAVVARRGAIATKFRAAQRLDEIGDLARSLEDVTRRLEEHVRFVEGFVADLSHEFKNPLASVRTVADTLPLLESDADRTRFLDLLDRDVQRLERLLAAVTDLVRIDVELEREAREWVDLVPILEGVVDTHRLRAGGATPITLTARGAMTVRGRPEHLAQVVDNLLSNAVSFNPPGQPVTVGAELRGAWCELIVIDRGPGIPAAHKARVFDRFFSYRPGQAQARLHHSGLGLSICRAIVDAYGGTIELDDADGGGTCARVRLAARPRVF